jgi:hypothetical protein
MFTIHSVEIMTEWMKPTIKPRCEHEDALALPQIWRVGDIKAKRVARGKVCADF